MQEYIESSQNVESRATSYHHQSHSTNVPSSSNTGRILKQSLSVNKLYHSKHIYRFRMSLQNAYILTAS